MTAINERMTTAVFVRYLIEGRGESMVIEFENARAMTDQGVINIARRRAPPDAWLSEVTLFDREYDPKTILINELQP